MSSAKDSTICAHAGSSVTYSSNTSGGYSGKKAIWQASVYDFESLDDAQNCSYFYRRYGCPNTVELGAAVAALEGAEAGLATSTGMGAILAAVMSVCKSGDLIIVNSDVYGVSYEFFNVDMRRFGIDVVLEDVFEAPLLEKTLEKFSGELLNGSTRRNVVVFLESITNPLVKVANIFALANICRKYAATLIVDNTMATPLRLKPLVEGADLVIHSATKYLGGHSDCMAGIVVGSSNRVDQAAILAQRWGLTSTPFDAWLAVRGIHTLQVRMQRAWLSAAELSDRCLASGLALRTLSAPMCAIVCIEVCGGLEGAKRAIKAFNLIKLSPSFGGTSTIVSHSASSSHKCLGVELREKLGISDGILRVSVGLEDVEDIWADLQVGLLAASK
eukprot:c16542_g1_i1 orf=325-1488(-)